MIIMMIVTSVARSSSGPSTPWRRRETARAISRTHLAPGLASTVGTRLARVWHTSGTQLARSWHAAGTQLARIDGRGGDRGIAGGPPANRRSGDVAGRRAPCC